MTYGEEGGSRKNKGSRSKDQKSVKAKKESEGLKLPYKDKSDHARYMRKYRKIQKEAQKKLEQDLKKMKAEIKKLRNIAPKR